MLAAEKSDRFDAKAAAELLAVRYEIAEPLLGEVPLLSAPGVFCRKHLDDGTRALLTALDQAELATPRRIVDLGAGIGPLALWAARRWPKGHVLAVESNVIAAGLVRENATRLGCERVEALLSDGLPAAHPWRGTVELALVNPPTHAPPEAFAALVKPLPHWLRDGGEAWFVVNRSGRLVQVLKDTRAQIETLEAPGFWIVRARWGG
nr:methyltransferase [Nannocystis sp. SCPEA4]